MTIGVSPVTASIGAEIDGVDLQRPLPDGQREEIQDALMEHLVLFFRDQPLSESQQLAFASNFGPPVSASLSDQEEMLFVSLEDSVDSPPKADRWHTDVPFAPRPPNIAVLAMLDAPPVGGDTLWLSLYAVYESLSPTMQRLLADLELDLDLGTTADTILELYGEEYHRKVLSQFEDVRHPLVRVHPVTGRPALYLCGSFMKGITGMQNDESEALLGFLQSRLDNPNVQCRWRWKTNDVAMWDERCTNHRATADHYPSHRLIRRCLAGQDVPIGIRP
jgi:taurine dioxygenase